MFSYVISDASIIGLECESGNIDDCNDGTEESVPAECTGIFLAPAETTQCGSKCSANARTKYKTKKNSYWLYYKSKVFINIFTCYVDVRILKLLLLDSKRSYFCQIA